VQKLLKISQQTFWQIIVKIATSGTGLITLGIITRTYGETGTGNFTLALTYLAYFYTIADFGFNAHVLESLQATGSRQQLEWRKLLGARILWGGFLTLLSIILLFLLFPSFSGDFKLAVLIGSPIILFYALNITSLALFQVKHRYDLDIFPTLVGVLVCFGIVLFTASNGLPIYLAILGYLIAWFIHSFGTLVLSKRFLNNFKPIFDKTYIKNLFIDTWPIAGTLVLNTVYFRIDSFILAFYYPASVVGIYNVAYQIFQSLMVLPVFVMNSFYPLMLQTINSVDKFKNQIKLASIGLFFSSILVTIVTYLSAPFAINLITGAGFGGSVESLRILSLSFPAFFLSALLMWVMIAKKMYKKMFFIYTLGLLFNLVANITFIPQGSFIAASYITGISEYLILTAQIAILFKR
jgi:O-antigen/teichoic acid export membrane protein